MRKSSLVFFILSLYLPLFAIAANKVLMPTDKLPRELIYLTESLQELQIKDIEKTKENDAIFKKLSSNFQVQTKEEIYFITKSEIYKTALAFKPSLNTTDKFYQKAILEEVEGKLKTVKLNSFSHWLIGSILKDIKDIFGSRHFPSFYAERNRGAVVTAKSKRIQKKLNFLLPWIQSFMNEDTTLFQYSLIPLMKKSLEKIELQLSYLNAHSQKLGDNEEQEKVVYFEEQKLELDKLGKLITVEDILDPLLGQLKNKNLPVPVDDWIENEDDFAKGLTPIKVLKPEGNYKAPEKLPKPAAGW